MYILSQILVVISDIFFIVSMLSKKKKNIVLFLIISTILFSIHFMCLGGWTGAAMGLVELIFLILMYLLELKEKTKYNKYVSIVTIIVTITLSILTWDTYISIFPMLYMTIYLITMMFKNVIIVKSGTFIRLILAGIYMLLLKSYFGAILSIILIVFTIIGITNDIRRKNKLNV